MGKITVSAAKIRQGKLTLYTTSLKVGELVSEADGGFYDIDELDPNKQDKGYQRVLNETRAKRLADYIISAQKEKGAFLPTAIFLATSKDIDFNESNNTIEIDTSVLCPFLVVDGQHRLEGLKIAAKKDERVKDFEIPVNIAVKLSRIDQMVHFFMVNTTQKSVDKSIEQRILARLTARYKTENLPSLPKQMLKNIEQGKVEKALDYVEFLNKTEGSPWLGKIRMTNERTKDGKKINQGTFVRAIEKHVTTASNPLIAFGNIEKSKKVFLNYWKALANILDDGNETVLYKHNGVELFCRFSTPFFQKMQNLNSFKVDDMTKALQECFDNIEDDEYTGIGHPQFWKVGDKASGMNRSMIGQIYHVMVRALHYHQSIDGIETE
jgi:DGQHR domain-containing protein